MNLLIVDDSMSVVNGLRENVDWESIGVTQTFGAYSVFEGRLCLQANAIDILLCDIEMPIEDGLSLLTWIREQGMDICVIMLTAHAEFPYAQRCIKLDVFDYVLQPSPYHEIAAAVERAVQQVKQNALEREINRYGKRYLENQESILASVLWAWITDVGDQKEVDTYAAAGSLPRREEPVCLALLQPIGWKQVRQWKPKLCMYAMQDMLTKLVQPIRCKCMVLSAGPQRYGLVIWGGHERNRTEFLHRQMELLSQSCKQYFQFSPAIYYTCLSAASGLPQGWEYLSAARQNNVANTPGVYSVDAAATDTEDHFVLDKKLSEEWVMQLAGARPTMVEQSANDLLEQMIAEKRMNARNLQDFYHEFLNVLNSAVPSEDIFWARLAKEQTYGELYHNAQYALDDMRALIHLVVAQMQEKPEESELQLIRQVDDYINHHMEEIIHRTDLAQALFLNADYLNRIFKQETGKTIKEYIIERKMNMARRLLTTTKLPVNLVAARVGFGQLSHFSATYKRIFDRTPMQERKENDR